METYITLLRGINVSGSKMIKMDHLKQLYTGLQFSNVQTYIQSGNVIFSTVEKDLQSLEKLISDEIKIQFGFEVPVIIIRKEELVEILKNNPFVPGEAEIDTAHLYVTILKDIPSPSALEMLLAADYNPEKFALLNQTIYLSLPLGYGNARLNNNFFETRLKTRATTRNWKTLGTLAKLAE